MESKQVYIGTDSGATTSKIGAVWSDGTTVPTKLLQRPTNLQLGTAAVVVGWVEAISEYLCQNALNWAQVAGVGLAIPGPFQRYGVLDHSGNMPLSYTGWDVHRDFSSALSERAGRAIPLVVGNDGNLGGVAEAQYVRGNSNCSVLMLAPGSGLGAAFIDNQGLPLTGDTLAGMEGGHMPVPLHLLDGIKPYPCGCGRDWGCFEVYTTIFGLPYLLAEKLQKYPDHPLARSSAPIKEKVLSLRGLAQKDDLLATEIFDFQARVLGLHVANLVVAFDPTFVVIGGGLMDPENTTAAFRKRYLDIVDTTSRPYLWPYQRTNVTIMPAVLGDLSQAIGAALVALYKARS